MQNESTPDARGPVFCGVDTHADSHWLCVLDWRGRKVLSRRFPADAAGYEALAGACVSSRGFEQKEHRKLSSLSIGSAHAF